MSPLGTLLRGLRIGKKLDVKSMASQLGTDARRLELIERGSVFPAAMERRKWAIKLGFRDLLDFDRQWRDGWARVTLAHRSGYVPIINRAPAGQPVDYEEYGIDSGVGYEYVARSPGMEDEILFAVIVIGDSMSPAYIQGDLVIFRPLNPFDAVPDGSPVFVRLSSERDHVCTFKSLWLKNDGHFELRPENPKYLALIVKPEEIDRMALAIERRPQYWKQPPVRRLCDQYAQEFPEEH